MDDHHSGAHLLRWVFDNTVPGDGRLRMLNSYFNRADTAADLDQRRSHVAACGLPQEEIDRLYHKRHDLIVGREA